MLPQDLHQLLDQPGNRWPLRDWALLDIREAGEFDAGHIPGATNLPRRMIERRVQDLLPDPNVPIILIDAGLTPFSTPDRRAEYAERTLHHLGYTHIQRLEGGIAAWRSQGLTLATGTNVPSKLFGEQVKAAGESPSIPPEELHGLCASGAPLVIRDVRTMDEFLDHHLPGATCSPGFDLAGELGAFLDADHPLVLSCAGRTRSIIATATARALGANTAVSLENGTMGWRLAGLAVETGPVAATTAFHDGGIIRERAEALALGMGVDHIAPQELQAKLTEGPRPVILDLRPVADFAAGHIKGALNVPGGQAIQRTDDYLAAPGRAVVLCDQDELRALLAGYWLKRMGFAAVQVLAGGVNRWTEIGLPLATGRHERREPPAPLVTPLAPEIAASAMAAAPDAYRVIDIRTSHAFAAGHVPGAVWVPHGWLETALDHDPSLQGASLLVGDDTDQARLTASALVAAGHALPAVLSGGMKAWRAAGLPEEKGMGEQTRWLPDLFEPPYARSTETMKAYLDWEIALHSGA